MVFSCLGLYVLTNNARVVPYLFRRVWPPLKTMYYSLIKRNNASFTNDHIANENELSLNYSFNFV